MLPSIHRWAAALATVIALARPAAAAPEPLVVLTPAATSKVSASDLASASASIRSALSLSEERDDDAMTRVEAASCAVDASCLAAAGQRREAERVVGVLLEPGDDGVMMTLVMVQVASQEEVARERYPIAAEEIATAPGTRLIEFLLLVGEEIDVSPPPPADQAPPPVEPEPEPADPAPDAGVRRWGVGVRVGAEIPRSDLGAGILVGASAGLAVDAGAMLVARLAVDWTSLGNRGSAFLSPPSYPRSMAELDQRSNLLTVSAGGSVRVARLGAMDLRVAAGVGVQFSRTRFEAFAMTRTDRDIAPVGTVEVELLGPAGPFTWRATVGWREARSDLGADDSFGEDVMSGLLITAGGDW